MNYIWEDKQRFLNIPLPFIKYECDGKKLLLTEGIFSLKQDQVNLYRVLDFQVNVSLLDRLLNRGTVILTTDDVNNKYVYLRNIANPFEVRNLLSNLVEESRINSKVRMVDVCDF